MPRFGIFHLSTGGIGTGLPIESGRLVSGFFLLEQGDAPAATVERAAISHLFRDTASDRVVFAGPHHNIRAFYFRRTIRSR